jgi:hypothetical protein
LCAGLRFFEEVPDFDNNVCGSRLHKLWLCLKYVTVLQLAKMLMHANGKELVWGDETILMTLGLVVADTEPDHSNEGCRCDRSNM